MFTIKERNLNLGGVRWLCGNSKGRGNCHWKRGGEPGGSSGKSAGANTAG